MLPSGKDTMNGPPPDEKAGRFAVLSAIVTVIGVYEEICVYAEQPSTRYKPNL
jgi:hypothetical protein